VAFSGNDGLLMSLFHRTRRVPATSAPSNALAGGSHLVSSAVAGVSAALVSMLVVAVPMLLAWVASPESTVTSSRALSVGASVWLLANGAELTSGAATISLIPLLLTTTALAVATTAARRILWQLNDEPARRLRSLGGLRRDVAGIGLIFVLSYAAVGLVAAVATSGAPLHATLWRSVMGTAIVGTLSVLLAIVLEFRGRLRSVAPELSGALEARLPVHLRRAISPGLWGAAAIFGAGVALTVGMVVTHLGRMGRLYDAVGADPVGMVALSLGQLMVLPNVALWAASWMAGPGFGLGEGTAVTWSQSTPGLLPLIPGLGAVPAPGPLPAFLWLSVLVPVAAGTLVGWRALRVVTRLSSWQAKASTAALACLAAALVLTLASVLAGGSLGSGRLTGLGAPSFLFGMTVLGEMLLGASVVVCLSHWRATRP
jgi:Family of unknown function (DUF6350)